MKSPLLVPGEESMVVVDLGALRLVVVTHVAALAARFPEENEIKLQGLKNIFVNDFDLLQMGKFVQVSRTGFSC